MLEKPFFCHACGHAVVRPRTHVPSKCFNCGTSHYCNPLPVVNVLQPIRLRDTSLGLVQIKRAIRPDIGAWVLPGGYCEIEHWQDAAARELEQETGIRVDKTQIRPYHFASAGNLRTILLFGLAPIIDERDLPPFSSVPNEEGIIEIAGHRIARLTEIEQMIWRNHRHVASAYLRGLTPNFERVE